VADDSVSAGSRRQLLVYLEAGPVSDEVVATGLNRAAVPLLKSVRDIIDRIVIYPTQRWYSNSDFDASIAMRCISLGPFWTRFYGLMRRIKCTPPMVAEGLPAAMAASASQSSAAEMVLSFVGSDVGAVFRTERLARRMGKPYALYLVDDFILPMELTGRSARTVGNVSRRAGHSIRNASHVFTITDGLGELVRRQYGVESETLALAFEPGLKPNCLAKLEIVFVGNISFLYADGLKCLFAAVRTLRAELSVDLRVRLTAHESAAIRELGELPYFVRAEAAAGAQELAEVIASSLFAFLPYTFDETYRRMVETSFPSKCMEYFAFARSIVVLAPDYGTSVKYFRGLSLPTICDGPEALKAVIRDHLSEHHDYGDLYLAALKSRHSLAVARRTLIDSLVRE
jgi:hypothetical protein